MNICLFFSTPNTEGSILYIHIYTLIFLLEMYITYYMLVILIIECVLNTHMLVTVLTFYIYYLI